MANVNISIQASLLNSANYFVVTAYSDPARTIVKETQIPTKPYGSPFQVTFTSLTTGIMYYFVLWENTTAVPGGVARNSCSFEPETNTTTVRGDLYLTADVTTGFNSGGASYVDTSLVGWGYGLEMLGYGTLEKDVDYTQDSGGGWTLINASLIPIQPQQKFVVQFQPQIAPTVVSQPSLINSSELITTNTTLANTDKNKALLLQGTGTTLVITLPALSTLSDCDVIYLYSCGGNHVNASIRCHDSDTIQRKTQVGKVVLGQNETLKLFKVTISETPYYFVDGELIGVDNVGELLESYYQNEINTIPFDGSLVSRTVYERLWDKVKLFQSGVLIAESAWAKTDTNGNFMNKGFFSTGDGSTTFRMPDLRIYPTRRAVDGSNRIPGSFVDYQMIDHQHIIPGGEADASNGQGYGHNPNPLPGTGLWNGQGNKRRDFVSKPIDNTGAILKRIGAELRTASTGIFALCRI